jgi:hypothetical protein
MEFALYRYLSKLFAAIGMNNEHISLERHPIRQVTVYDVTEDEIERIESTAGEVGLDFPIFLGCVTSALSVSSRALSQ